MESNKWTLTHLSSNVTNYKLGLLAFKTFFIFLLVFERKKKKTTYFGFYFIYFFCCCYLSLWSLTLQKMCVSKCTHIFARAHQQNKPNKKCVAIFFLLQRSNVVEVLRRNASAISANNKWQQYYFGVSACDKLKMPNENETCTKQRCKLWRIYLCTACEKNNFRRNSIV